MANLEPCAQRRRFPRVRRVGLTLRAKKWDPVCRADSRRKI